MLVHKVIQCNDSWHNRHVNMQNMYQCCHLETRIKLNFWINYQFQNWITYKPWYVELQKKCSLIWQTPTASVYVILMDSDLWFRWKRLLHMLTIKPTSKQWARFKVPPSSHFRKILIWYEQLLEEKGQTTFWYNWVFTRSAVSEEMSKMWKVGLGPAVSRSM